ncbi:hypothetical protein FB45DRAFT_1042884 [Roridomyces roridus]|uniref:Uncharacterized protein n=1 Tax=Roridomyces roridus TaxID=1738132 RepID=A0AAD7AZF8_9AGAR|nr:hypothetical protein FB45DRAFT_1042884 [Roridomyces roridus]
MALKPTASFNADLEPIPLPVHVLIAHLDLDDQLPSLALLNHEDLGEYKPKSVTFDENVLSIPHKDQHNDVDSRNDHRYPPVAADKIVAAAKIKSPGKPSTFTIDKYSKELDWSTHKIAEFKEFVHAQGEQLLDLGLAWTHQTLNASNALISVVVNRYPEIDDFWERWPLESVIIAYCKNQAAKTKKAAQLQVTDAGKSSSEEVGGRQLRRRDAGNH